VENPREQHRPRRHPHPINTAAWDNPEAYQSLLKLIPYKRIGEADEIGRSAVWLASDDRTTSPARLFLSTAA